MVSNLINPRCPHCGEPVSRGVKFCGSCGQPQAGGKVKCGNCGAENHANATFCGQCGQAIQQSAVAEVRNGHWARQPEDFAVRIESLDLPGLLRSGLAVEQGTNAMLVERGQSRGVFAPGFYTLEKVEKKIFDWLTTGVAAQTTALLVDITPADLDFNLGGRFSKDPLPVGLSLRLQVEVMEPGRFLVNMLGSRERLTKEDLRQYLYPEVVGVIDRWLAQHTLQELAEEYTLHEHLELALEQALKKTFAQTGLGFKQVRAMNLNLEPFDKIKGLRGSYALWQMEARVKLEGDLAKAAKEDERHAFEERVKWAKAQEEVENKRRYYELNREQDLLEIVKETDKVKDEEQRVELYARMRRALMSDKMNEVRSEAEFDRFMNEIDQDKLLHERDRQEMVRIWREGDQDRDKARAHLLAKIEVERDYDLRLIQLKLQYGEDQQKLDHEIEISRKRADFELEMRRRTAEESLRIEQERTRIQQERDQIEIERQKSRLELNRLQRQTERNEDREDAMLAMELLQKMKQIRFEEEDRHLALQRLDKRENYQIEREHEVSRTRELQRIEMERWEVQERQRQAEREHGLRVEEQKLKAQESTQQYDLLRLEQIGNLGPSALAAISGPEQGKILVELARTEAMRGMSEDQIKMMVAERSPEVARALQEAYRTSAETKAGQETHEWIERMLKETDASRQREVDLMREAALRERESYQSQMAATERMHNKGLDAATQMARDIAQATSKGGNQAPIIITPSAGAAQVISHSMDGRAMNTSVSDDAGTKTCPDCGRSIPAAIRYCSFCGHPFKGMGD